MTSRTVHGPAVDTEQSRNRLKLLWTTVILLNGMLLFFQLGSQTLRRHEAYVGVSAREMLATGDWLVSRYGGHPRLEKPPLAYWLVAGLGWLQGGIDEWTVRFPAAFSALLLVGLMGFWGTKWYGTRVGLSAGFILATSSFTIIWGRTGVVDLPLTLLTTSGLYLLANFCCQRAEQDLQNCVERPQACSRQIILAYCLLGLSSLAKPAFGLVLVMLACATFLLIQCRPRELVRLANPVGLLIVLLLTFAWPYLVSQQAPEVWRIWFKETVGRASGATPYGEPFWFYTGPVLSMLAPWTPVILVAVPHSWRRAWKRGDVRERFLWVCFLSQFLALSLSVGKSAKYILPALPVLCLIGAQKLANVAMQVSGNRTRAAPVRSLVYAIALSSCILAAAVLVSTHYWPELTTHWQTTAIVFGIGLFLAAYFWTVGARWRAAWTILCASLVCYLIVTAAVVPYFDVMRPAAQFARNVTALLPPEREVVVYGLNRSAITFYVKGQPAVEEDLTVIQTRLISEPSIYVLTGKNSMNELKRIGDVLTLFETDPSFENHVDYRAGLALVRVTSRFQDPPR